MGATANRRAALRRTRSEKGKRTPSASCSRGSRPITGNGGGNRDCRTKAERKIIPLSAAPPFRRGTPDDPHRDPELVLDDPLPPIRGRGEREERGPDDESHEVEAGHAA